MAGKGKHVQKKEVDKKKIIMIAAIIALMIAAVAACVVLISSSKNKAQEDIVNDITEENLNTQEFVEDEPVEENKEPEEKQDENKPEIEETIYDGPVNPLTGLPVDEDISANRPYAVMINNLKVAVPQDGIGSADIIYETLAEGGITRLVAIYQDISVVDTIGSVRSSRPYFLDLAQAHDAIYIHAGGSDDAYTQIKARGVTNIDGVNGSGETFFRDSWRQKNMGYEHSLMLNTTLLPDYISKYSIRSTHNDDYKCNMVFSDDPDFEGETGENVIVTFSSGKNTSFAYDQDSGLYTVSQYNTTMIDSIDDSDVQVKNIIVLYASISKISGDTVGRLKMTLTGSGDGYFICNGKYTEIVWSKDSYTSQFEYALKDGTQVEFGRGTTYVTIIPTSEGKVSFD